MIKKRIIFFFGIFIILVFTIIFFINKFKSSPQNPTPNTTNQSAVVQEIDWNTAANLIRNCQIRVIFQAKTLQLNLRGFDNQLYYTLEPKFDDVVNLAKEVQGPCDIIQIVTE